MMVAEGVAYDTAARHYPVGDVPICGADSLTMTESYGEVSCGTCRRELQALGVIIAKVHFASGRKKTLCKVENDRHRRALIDRSNDWSHVTCGNCWNRKSRTSLS